MIQDATLPVHRYHGTVKVKTLLYESSYCLPDSEFPNGRPEGAARENRAQTESRRPSLRPPQLSEGRRARGNTAVSFCEATRPSVRDHA